MRRRRRRRRCCCRRHRRHQTFQRRSRCHKLFPIHAITLLQFDVFAHML